MSERKYFIDWLRVLAFFLLIFFHCAMPFVIFSWEVKNKEHSVVLSRLIWWLHQWRLPLLFFVSGVGMHFSLRKRTVLGFAGERVVRLLIPLLFAMFFTIPLQVYFERLQKKQITGSYVDFYPTVWQMMPYPEGTLTWSHMWFVVYLFVYCILLLPVFALFKIIFFQRYKQWLADNLSNPVAATLLFIPLAIYYFTLYLKYPEQQSLLDDWFLFIFSLTLVIYGYIIASSNRFWETCEKYRRLYLATAVACIFLLFAKFWWNFDMPKQRGYLLYVYGALNALHIWMIILSAAGFAKKYLNFTSPFLQYANQAIYPFYIIHQTIIVAFGYYIVQWQQPVFVKLIVLIICCFSSISMIYNYLIRPFIITRILFGMKLKKRKVNKRAEVSAVV
ncbi:MAG: acyltransferase [Bacteroidetes bacterium]|nr:acyltransferase [Bacteroidota bacterium]